MLRSQVRSLPLAPPEGRKVNFPSPSIAFVDEALGPGGHLAKLLPGYESRPEQLQMSRAVAKAIEDKKHLLVEAPCGVGKGYGYLVPAIKTAVDRGQKVIVVTANINLQEQLIRKDLPILREALPMPFSFAIAKGRANWLCSEAFEENDPQRDPKWPVIQHWAATTKEGDVSELPFEPGSLRRFFTVSAEDCIGPSCPKRDQCFAERAKEAYSHADVIVTNYHLFLLDLLIKTGDPNAGPLPAWSVAILDEAHNCPDISRELLGWKVSKGSIEFVASLLSKSSASDDAQELRVEAASFFESLLSHFGTDAYKARLRAPGEIGNVELLASLLSRASRDLERASEDEEPKRRARLKKGAIRAETLAGYLRRGDALVGSDRRVYCIEVDIGETRRVPRAALGCKLIWPADVLRPKLFDVPGRVVVCTSATLATDGNFDYIAHELGCEGARELAVPSPFDFARQAILVVPRDAPDPKRRDDHERWAAETLLEVVTVSQGRLLGLFTSYRGLKQARATLDRFARSSDRTWGEVLVQGDAPRPELLRRFKAEVNSVLLGTDSFWEGVDVPGEALSVVVIDRIPFATPDDPVLDAADAMLPRGAFKEWSLPRAITAIRQGVGRLIRAKTDRGVVVVLDDRILTKPYGRAFIRSLPPMPLSRNLSDIGTFLDQGKIQL